jgi:hypothetical protein
VVLLVVVMVVVVVVMMEGVVAGVVVLAEVVVATPFLSSSAKADRMVALVTTLPLNTLLKIILSVSAATSC